MGSLDDLFTHIHTYPRLNVLHAELGDNPATHRWRAGWTEGEGDKTDIELRPVPVIKLTPAGAWIDPDSWCSNAAYAAPAPGYPHGWNSSGSRRWVANNSGSAWAKPTQEEALRSLVIRLDRWASRLVNDLQHIRSAIDAAEELLPQHHRFATSARLRLPRQHLDPDEIEAWLNRRYPNGDFSPATGSTEDLAREIARYYRDGA